MQPASWLRRLPGLAWRVVLYEVSLYVSLARWVARRPSIPAGTRPVGYAQLVTPVMAIWIFASAVEIPVAHVLLPWDGARMAVLALGVWGLVWMVGLMASLRVYPHLVTDEGIRVRHASHVDVPVDWSNVVRVTARDSDLPSSIRTLQTRETDDDGTELHVAVSGGTNVRLDLRQPVQVPTRNGVITARSIAFLVDDPRAFVVATKAALGGAPAARP